MQTEDGLVHACFLDGEGGAEFVSVFDEAAPPSADGRVFWLHLDRTSPAVQEWVGERAGLEPLIAEALLVEHTRPRYQAFPDGVLVVLRGVNLNPGAEPDDMISLRMWITPKRVITLRSQPLYSVAAARAELEKGRGAEDVGDLLSRIAEGLIDRAITVIEDIEDRIDEIEAELLEDRSSHIVPEVRELRRKIIHLRRYFAPQRDALAALSRADSDWLAAHYRLHLREIADRGIRLSEHLEELRERAALVQEEIANRLSERMNRTMYVLTLVAAVMLPLGVVTGLLGVNVGGIPGAESKNAFWILCAILALLVTIQVWLFRRLKWL